jgi:hypothetical protein
MTTNLHHRALLLGALLATVAVPASAAAVTLPPAVDPGATYGMVLDAAESSTEALIGAGPVVGVEGQFDTAEQAIPFAPPLRDDVERVSQGIVPANEASAYPDHLQVFAKFYTHQTFQAALAMAPSELPKPDPGSVPAVLSQLEAYSNDRTSPASLVGFVLVLFPDGAVAPWLSQPVDDLTGFSVLNAIRSSPDLLFGPEPPSNGVVVFVVNTGASTVDALVVDQNSPGGVAARGMVAALLGQGTADLLFGAAGPGNTVLGATVRCFADGDAADWVGCIAPAA